MRVQSLAVVLAGVVGLFAAEALACRCRAPDPSRAGAAANLASSAAAFRGKVLRVSPIAEQDPSRRLRITFEVSQSWKGVTTTQIDVATAGDTAACGIYAEVGSEFLVFAQATEDGDAAQVRYSAHACNGTSPISQVEDGQPEWLVFLAEQPTLTLQQEAPGAEGPSGTDAGQGADDTVAPDAQGATGAAPAQHATAPAEAPQHAGGCASCSTTGLGLGLLPLLLVWRLLRRRRP